MSENFYSHNFTLSFDVQELPEGTIDILDFANSAQALGRSIKAIADLENYTKEGELLVELKALKTGSFEAEIVINLDMITDAAQAILPTIASTAEGINLAKKAMDTLGGIIKAKKFLRGEKPQQATLVQEGDNAHAEITNINGETINVNINVFNGLTDTKVNRYLKKLVDPLSREDGSVQSITLKDEADVDNSVDIERQEAPYFERQEEIQSTSNYKIKGIITAFDRKTGSGWMTVGKKRVRFEAVFHPGEYDKHVSALIDSLKLKSKLYIEGDATLDLESNLKKILIKKVAPEENILK